jgi:hypothetical protein
MSLLDTTNGTNHNRQLPPDAPLRAIIAFDQLTGDEQDAVLTVLSALEHRGSRALSDAGATRLAGTEPFYVLRPSPDVRVLVRVGEGESILVMDIVRPEALRNFAHAT